MLILKEENYFGKPLTDYLGKELTEIFTKHLNFLRLKYPVRLSKLDIDDLEDITHAKTDQITKTIKFNKKHFGENIASLEDKLKSAVKSGWYPLNTENILSTLTHEYGHLILDTLEMTDKDDLLLRYFNKLSKEEIASGLSRYAATNYREFVAEAFKEYIHNPNPRKIAKNVGHAIDMIFNGQGDNLI